MKFKFDHNGKNYILTIDQLLEKHDDLSRLKNPKIFLGMQDAYKKDLYAGDRVRVKTEEQKYERGTKISSNKWEVGVIEFMESDLKEGFTEKDLMKDKFSFVSFGLASYVVRFDGYCVPLSGFKNKNIIKI